MSDIDTAIRTAIETALPGSRATVSGNGTGHFTIDVIASQFEGKRPLDRQRLVYGAIASLMKGETAPVHAVDQLVTRTS